MSGYLLSISNQFGVLLVVAVQLTFFQSVVVGCCCPSVTLGLYIFIVSGSHICTSTTAVELVSICHHWNRRWVMWRWNSTPSLLPFVRPKPRIYSKSILKTSCFSICFNSA